MSDTLVGPRGEKTIMFWPGESTIKDMLARGWSYNRIARKLEVSASTLRSWCLTRGLKSKHRPIVRRRKKTAA